jgi:hypothetical protein
MNNRNFDEAMERLNRCYDEMPARSSSANIMANIKKKKKRNWISYYQHWQAAALIVLMIGIGYVLGVSQLSGQKESAQHSELSSADQGTPETEMGIAAIEEAGEAEVFTAEDNEVATREIPEVLKDNENTLEITNEEGFQEVIQVNMFTDDEFGFTTKHDERLEVHFDTNDYGRAVQWFANYDGETPVEPVVLEIFKFENPESYGEQVKAYRIMMRNFGYQESFSKEYMKGVEIPAQSIEELLFEREGVYAHVVPAQHGEDIYFFKTSLFAPGSEYIEYSEGFGRDVKVIYDNFSWLYN